MRHNVKDRYKGVDVRGDKSLVGVSELETF